MPEDLRYELNRISSVFNRGDWDQCLKELDTLRSQAKSSKWAWPNEAFSLQEKAETKKGVQTVYEDAIKELTEGNWTGAKQIIERTELKSLSPLNDLNQSIGRALDTESKLAKDIEDLNPQVLSAEKLRQLEADISSLPYIFSEPDVRLTQRQSKLLDDIGRIARNEIRRLLGEAKNSYQKSQIPGKPDDKRMEDLSRAIELLQDAETYNVPTEEIESFLRAWPQH